jgi:hypothetical protein
VLPIVEANRAQIVKSDFALNKSIQFVPTPEKYPELGMQADYDSRQAGQTRRKVFDRFCDTSTIMCVVHFPSPSTGRGRRWGDGYKFVA